LLLHFSGGTGTIKTLKIPLDAKFDGEQLQSCVSTADSDGNGVKMASEVGVVKWGRNVLRRERVATRRAEGKLWLADLRLQ
jgi:2-phospho-L-lactate transferase/gluconeogenesis factor (CofD/UPF0052 family)